MQGNSNGGARSCCQGRRVQEEEGEEEGGHREGRRARWVQCVAGSIDQKLCQQGDG